MQGYRHLHSIAIKNNQPNAEDMRNLYEKCLKKLKGKDKKIMVAYLHIIDGDMIEKESNNHEDANKQYYQALELLEKCGDYERAVKVYYRIGYTHEKMGQNLEALENYLLGFIYQIN